MPAKQPFCRLEKVYQTGRSEAPLARLKLTAFCTLLRRFSSSTDAAISAARRSSSGSRDPRPALDELGEARLHAEARELAAELVRQPVQGSPPRAVWARSAAQTHVWP